MHYYNQIIVTLVLLLLLSGEIRAQPITTYGQPAQLDIRQAGDSSIRLTLKPLTFSNDFPYTPVLVERNYPEPAISIRELSETISRQVGNIIVEVLPKPLTVTASNADGELIQKIVFQKNGSFTFKIGNSPILGMGEGGPRPPEDVDWRKLPIEFDRRGRFHHMHPRWQANAYGSRNPVSLMIGTEGWGLFIATPWGRIDLEDEEEGVFIPRERTSLDSTPQDRRDQHNDRGQGIPPLDTMVPGLYDLFIFDAHNPAAFMKDISLISGKAVMPPKWALGYMQSHRTLEDDEQMLDIVETFRAKEIPLDAVIYLGTGFTPRGWNTEQPSFQFNPEVFKRNPREVIADIHDHNVKFVVHMIPWSRDKLRTLHGNIPPKPGETVDESHILSYWEQHTGLVEDGVDAWWPDEGDWFNLFERIKRHQMYYQGPLSTEPDKRPWSLHRNGHLGIAKWGGWVWSGDTQSSWKSLEGQIAVGINHSLSLSPFWGSDIGGFYSSEETTGELYARWFQFGAFSPSFRTHRRTWWTGLPWGWGLSELGPIEDRVPPKKSELNNPDIEPIAKKYAELRYQLMPYTYTLARQARDTVMPMMRAMWLHYPDDNIAAKLGDQYLWGRDLLIAPVYEQGAEFRTVYLPEGEWYDWWTLDKQKGGKPVVREVDLSILPIYVRAGAIIPFDPVRQYANQPVKEPTTLKVFRGADGDFTMYEDDGISLEYLEGEGVWTRFMWDDDENRLNIDPGNDGTPAEMSDRKFIIELLPEQITREVNYTGEPLSVDFDL